MRKLPWILLAPVVVSGCSYPSRIEFINETGRTLEVLLDRKRWVLASTVLRIRPGLSDATRLYKLRDPGLRLRSGDCEYAYVLPRLYWTVNHRYVVRVRADFTISGLHEGWALDPRNELLLRPDSRTCSG